jgi:hypothetical protein
MEQPVTDHVDRDAGVSTRQVEEELNVSHKTMRGYLINSCSALTVYNERSLLPAGFLGRENFFRCFVQWNAFLSFFNASTNEACFGRDGVISIHNQHQWAEEKPHDVTHSRHQQQFGINVWAAMTGYCLVGPHVLPHRLTGNHYRDFLLYDTPKLLEDVPLAVRARMWYMYDGAPAHFSPVVRDVHLS